MARHAIRNPGTPLDLDRGMEAHVNKNAVERRTATLPGRRTPKKIQANAPELAEAANRLRG